MISEHEMQLVSDAFVMTQAAMQHAQARVNQAQQLQKQSVLRAPFAGRIVELQATAGQAVVNQCQLTPLLVLANTDAIDVHAMLPAKDLMQLKPGQSVEVQINTQKFKGRVTSIAWNTVEVQGELGFPVMIAVDNASGLRAGMEASVLY